MFSARSRHSREASKPQSRADWLDEAATFLDHVVESPEKDQKARSVVSDGQVDLNATETFLASILPDEAAVAAEKTQDENVILQASLEATRKAEEERLAAEAAEAERIRKEERLAAEAAE